MVELILKVKTILLAIALVSVLVAIPLYEFPLMVYGSKVTGTNFMFEYIKAWWQNLVRRLTGQYGPAERAEPSPETAEQYQTPPGTTIGEPTNVYDVIATVKANRDDYGRRVRDYIETNNVPNKPTQVDVYIVPEKIYLTIIWNGYNLEIHDGWIGDQGCKIYVVSTITSSLVMELYRSHLPPTPPDTLRSILLRGEANGELTYSFLRINPEVSTIILGLQVISSIIGIISGIGWMMEEARKRRF